MEWVYILEFIVFKDSDSGDVGLWLEPRIYTESYTEAYNISVIIMSVYLILVLQKLDNES